VLSLAETLKDPHARARGVVTTTRDEAGEQITHIGPLIKLSETPGEIRHVARMPGADSRAVLAELGFGKAEIDSMINEIIEGSDERLAKYLG
jgi:formyl-CoA transferase